MRRSLLASYTYHRYEYQPSHFTDCVSRPVVDRISALRGTWLKDVDIDYRLFYGQPPEGSGREPKPDEVFLDAPDGYATLPLKTKALAKWALDHGYDRLCKCDDDMWVHWDRMSKSKAFTQGDYAVETLRGLSTPPYFYGGLLLA